MEKVNEWAVSFQHTCPLGPFAAQLIGRLLAQCTRRCTETGNPFLWEICKIRERNNMPGWLTGACPAFGFTWPSPHETENELPGGLSQGTRRRSYLTRQVLKQVGRMTD